MGIEIKNLRERDAYVSGYNAGMRDAARMLNHAADATLEHEASVADKHVADILRKLADVLKNSETQP